MSKKLLVTALLSMSAMSMSGFEALYDEDFDIRLDDFFNECNNKGSLYDHEAYNAMHESDGTFAKSERFSKL